ncbi:MAG TPA: hypothetical protein ENJ43_02040 [Gammaproteobacteria bacterium]|nr:hypothetical protein [Gammaproteobacteria bacterium]
MNLIRIAIITFVVWMLIRMVKSYHNRIGHSRRQERDDIDTMVQCARCKLHVPKREAIRKGNRFYCCRRHADTDRSP